MLEHTTEAAHAWFDGERSNLVATIHAAADGGHHAHVWRLTRAVWRFLYRNGYHDDAIAALQRVLRSAERTGDEHAFAMACNYLAATYFRWGRWDEARDYIERAMAIHAKRGDLLDWANCLANRGKIEIRSGRYDAAAVDMEQAARGRGAAGAAPLALVSLDIDLGHVYMQQRRYPAAQECFQRFLDFAEAHDSDADRGLAFAHLGALELRQGHFASALDLLERSALLQTVGDSADLAEWTCAEGSAHRGLGNLDKALHLQRGALATIERCGSRYHECEVRIELSITLHEAGDDGEATDHLRQALHIADQLNLQPQRAKALETLATITNDDDLRKRADALYEQLALPRPVTAPTLDT